MFTHLGQIVSLMGLNAFSLLFGFSALLANSLVAKKPVAFSSHQQVSLLSTVLLNIVLTLKMIFLSKIFGDQQAGADPLNL